jgi:thiol-disulfide isomerase/thioredoxin
LILALVDMNPPPKGLEASAVPLTRLDRDDRFGRHGGDTVTARTGRGTRWTRWAARLGGALVILYLVTAGALFVLMGRSNDVAGRTLSLVPGPAFAVLPLEAMWCEARKGKLGVGDEAPDFELATRDGGSRVRLSSLREKPVVLVFGSYTCPPFRREMPELNRVYEDFRSRVAFYFVYIEEAHATDVWPILSNTRDNVLYANPKDMAERLVVANTCATSMKIEFPMLVDDMTNRVDSAYAAWPTRIYVVGTDGRILYKSRPGPFGFEAAPLRAALQGPASSSRPLGSGS